MSTDPKSLKPGMILRHSSGGLVTISRRKEDDSGWWMTDGAGLADYVWETDGLWTVADQPAEVEYRVRVIHLRPADYETVDAAITKALDGAFDLFSGVVDPFLTSERRYHGPLRDQL